MKTILLALLLSFNIFAQSGVEFITILQGSGGNNRDSIPNNYTFTDSTDAVVSTSIISRPVVLLGYDSAYVNVTGGDYRIGALGDTTRLSTQIFSGDTLWAIDTSSASNNIKTNVAFIIGGIIDTFSVTTVASGYVPGNYNPLFVAEWDDDSTTTEIIGGVEFVTGATYNGNNLFNTAADTSDNIFMTDSAFAFIEAGRQTNIYNNNSDSAYWSNIGNRDVSFELWIYPISTSYIYQKYQAGDFGVQLQVQSAAGLHFQMFIIDGNDNDSTKSISTYDGVRDGFVNGWHHVVFSWDRDLGIVIYVDGDSLEGSTAASWTQQEDVTNEAYTYLGYTTAFGYMTAFRMYPIALNQSQVTALFNYGKH